ncbi:MAG TPA: hypothetical protein VI670_21465 [Thermoanaerobaculia bacterium]|jgi:hypothetical protein
MSHAIAIAGREVAEKRFVFLAAAAFAAIAAIMPLIPGVHDGAEAVVITATILATAFAAGLAAILGATIVGRDIAAGRMSFYFARPVGGAAIWFGKLAAAAVLVVVSFAIAMAPALVAGPMTVKRIWSGSVVDVTMVIAVAAVVLFFLAHAIGTMIRSRSALIAADFAAAAIVVGIVWLLVRPLLSGHAIQAILVLGKALAWALLAAAVAAGAWQLIDGRSERRRSHRAFSTAFWALVAVALIAAAVFVGWIVSASPSDLHGRVGAIQAPQGDAAILSGDTVHRFDYRPTFLGGRHINTVAWAHFARDGQRVVTMEMISPLSPAREVVTRDAANGWRATPTKIVFRQGVWPAIASDDLSRIAAGEQDILTIYDVASSRVLGSFKPHNAAIRGMFFPTPDVLRVYLASPSLDVVEYDVRTRTLQKLGHMESAKPIAGLRVSPDGTRAVIVDRDHKAMLCDARTLQPIAPAALSSRFLLDGRLVDVPGRDLGEIAPGKVLVWREGGSTDLYDVSAGKIVARGDGLTPAWFEFWTGDPRPQQRNPNGYFLTKDGRLTRWNPLSS